MRSFSPGLIQTVFRRFSVLLLAKILLKLFGFLNVVLVARYLGYEGFGILSFGLAFVWVFLILADGGMSELYLRDISVKPDILKEYTRKIFTTKLVLAVFTYAAILISLHYWVRDPVKRQVIGLVGWVIILDSFMDFFRAILQITRPNSYELVSFFFEGFIKVSFILAAILWFHQERKILLISWALFLGSFVTCLGHYLFIKRRYPLWPPQFNPALSVKLLRTSFVFIASYVLFLLNFRIDILMLSSLMSDSVSGLYSVSSKLIEQTLMIPLTLGYVSLPVISSALSKGSFPPFKTLRPLLLWMGAVGALTSVILFSTGGILIQVIFGKQFLNAVEILRTLCWVSILFYMKPVLEKGLYSVNKQGVVFGIYFLSCLVKVALNQWWIPLWGVQGAVSATLICEMISLSLLTGQMLQLKEIGTARYVEEPKYHLSLIH